MAASTAPDAPAAGQPRPLRIILVWTMVLAVVALGGAGLAVAADRPGNPVERPELTYRADTAAQVWIDRLAPDLDAVQNDATNLSAVGRDALARLAALDLAGADQALTSGDDTSSAIGRVVSGLHETLDQAHAATDRWRLGPQMASLFDDIAAALVSAGHLPGQWTVIAAAGRAAATLIDALSRHDDAVSQANAAGRAGRWADGLALLRGAAADSLALAAGARDELAQSSPVDTLDDLLGRQGAYDTALAALYQYLAAGGAQGGAQFDALQAAVTQAHAGLPSDNAELSSGVSEAVGQPIADQLLAMETAHGAINDALQAISDAKFGAPPLTPPPDATPAP